MSKKAKVIAFYLPQFHPTPENDEWWGKGFTEWTNVGRAKKYYPGHYQPRVPADLGYYDLRIPDVREAQAKLAQESGIDAFCYWHYWFGNGRQLLDMPLKEVVRLGVPDFPFCLAWANHHWSRRHWSSIASRFDKTLLMKQEYTGIEDIDNHFHTMLPAFKDHRYFKVKGRLLFYIYSPGDVAAIDLFIERWRHLAQENDLPGFYFVGGCGIKKNIDNDCYKKCDAVNLDLKSKVFTLQNSKWGQRLSYIPIPVNIVRYKKAIKAWKDEILKRPKIYPTIIPNWDHSPRGGVSATILHRSTPELFKQHVEATLELIKDKSEDDKIIFLKSWNEWAQGNYMEPDVVFGKQYILALNKALTQE